MKRVIRLLLALLLVPVASYAERICPRSAGVPVACSAEHGGECFLDSSNVIRICNGSGTWQAIAQSTTPLSVSETAVLSGYGVTSVAGTATAATAAEGLDGIHRTVLTVAVSGTNKVTLADGDHGGGKVVYTFPDGYIYVLGATLDGTVTNTANFNASTDDLFYFAIGTATAADDNDLTATEADIIAKLTIDTASGTSTTRAETGVLATPAAFDGTSSAVTLSANFAVEATDNSDANDFTLTGTVVILWANIGDY